MKIYLLIFVAALVLASCTKEKSFEPGNGDSTGNMLVKRTIKLGSDSINTLYTYNNKNQLTSYTTAGVFNIPGYGSVPVSEERKFIRDGQGIIQQFVRVSSDFLSSTVDSTVFHLRYDASKSRYTSAVATAMDGGVMEKDSVAYTYNSAGRISQFEYFHDDGISGGYQEDFKMEFTYDSKGNIIRDRSFSYDQSRGAYEETAEEKFEYDDKVSPLVLGIEAFLLEEFVSVSPNNVTKSTFVDLEDPSENDTSTITYTYNTDNKPATASSSSQSSAGISIPINYVYK